MADGVALFTQDDTGEYHEYTPPSFTDSLPEDLREHEHLKEVGDGVQLAQSYVDLIKNQPVVPPDASGYSYDFPEGYELDNESFESFKKTAFESGITQKQFQQFLEFDVGRNQAAKESFQASVTQNRNNTENALRTEYGDNYDSKIESAKGVIRSYGNEEFSKFLEDSHLGDNPHMIRLLAWVAGSTSEDSLVNTEPRGTPQEGRKVGEDGRPMLDFSKSMKDGMQSPGS